MKNCIICNDPLTEENKSEEHIIQNSLGGRLKSSELICVKCNSRLGEGIDAKLSKELASFANILNIKRDDKESPQDIDGMVGDKKIVLKPGGKPELAKPEVKIEKSGIQLKIQIEARNKKELDKIVNGCVNKLKAKYPKINVEEILKQTQTRIDSLNTPIVNIQVTGDSFSALAKIIIMALYNRYPEINADTTKIVSFIKGESNYREMYYYYPEVDVVPNADGKIYHSIIINSYPAERLLIGIVELFSVVSVIMLISDNFAEELEYHYVFDVIETKEVESPLINYPIINKAMLDDLFLTYPPIDIKYAEKIKSFRSIVTLKRQMEYVDSMLERIFKKYPQGTEVTPEIVSEIADAVGNELFQR